MQRDRARSLGSRTLPRNSFCERDADGLRKRRRRGSAAEVFVGHLSDGQKLCVFDSPSYRRCRPAKHQGPRKQEKVGRKGLERGRIRCGCRCRRNSCALFVFDQNLLVVQIIGHRDDEKQDHQGAAHGHQFADITRRMPQARTTARQREDLREYRSDGHADPDQVECQLHSLPSYSKHAEAAKQHKERLRGCRRGNPRANRGGAICPSNSRRGLRPKPRACLLPVR